MMIKYVHLLIEAVYLICPIVACVRASRIESAWRRRLALQRLRLTVMVGTAVGVLICVGYASLLHGRLIFSQVLLTAYLAISLMVLLQLFDAILWSASRWILRLHHHRGPAWWYSVRAILGLLLRASVVFSIGLPYVLATVVTYRPRVSSTVDPQSLYQWNFENVSFPATDGTRIAGWWIPSTAAGDASQTVLLCPGANTDKATQLYLVRHLIPAGYNVLTFDFRAQGESAGQFCSYGDLERNDVLGAMRWLRKNHAPACRKIAGLGVSSGAAALLAAAADPSAEGQNIDVIAVYDTYDRLDNLVSYQLDTFLPPPLSWSMEHIGLPLASYQVGAHLSDFSPANQIQSIWPRPVLIIHGMDDEYIPFEEGESLYESALEPKMNFWIQRCGHSAALKNNAAARLVKQCFDAAQRVI